MVSNYSPHKLKPFQGQKDNSFYQTDVKNVKNRNNRYNNDKPLIYGKKLGTSKNSSSAQQISHKQSMSSSIPIPTIKTKLNRRIGSFPFQQRMQSRMGDDDASKGIDGGLLSLGNQLDILF